MKNALQTNFLTPIPKQLVPFRMPRTRKTRSSKSAPQARIDQFFTAKKVEKLLKVPNNPSEETEVEQEQEQHEQEQHEQEQQQEQEQEQVQVQSQSQNSDTQTDEEMLEEEFEEDLDDDEDDDWDDGEIVDDNELMQVPLTDLDLCDPVD